jgi:hypothetical protein
VVCGIHRGLIAGTMSQLGEPDTTVDLHPFADGERCIARLRSPAHVPPETDPPEATSPDRSSGTT